MFKLTNNKINAKDKYYVIHISCFHFLFLPITLAMYYLLKGHRKTQNIVLLAVSIIFYAWGEPEFVILLILSIIFNWLSAIIVDRLKKSPPPWYTRLYSLY